MEGNSSLTDAQHARLDELESKQKAKVIGLATCPILNLGDDIARLIFPDGTMRMLGDLRKQEIRGAVKSGARSSRIRCKE